MEIKLNLSEVNFIKELAEAELKYGTEKGKLIAQDILNKLNK